MTIVVYFGTKVFAYLIPVSLQLPNIQGAHFPHGSNKSHLLAYKFVETLVKGRRKLSQFSCDIFSNDYFFYFFCVFTSSLLLQYRV